MVTDAITSPIPPEVLFHRFFQEDRNRPSDRANYRGKQDLETLEAPVRTLLSGIQQSLNGALQAERTDISEHRAHPPFHFDYFESPVPNALAFQYSGYSFIGVTMELVHELWDCCIRLSTSGLVTNTLGHGVDGVHYEPLHVVLFQTQLKFVVVHEYTHHVHGHLLQAAEDSIFAAEILGGAGCEERQALELDADGYAVFYVLEDLLNGDGRLRAVRLLGLNAEKQPVQEEALLSCFIIAVGAFFFIRAPIPRASHVKTLTHPPPAARMRFVMQNVVRWYGHNRPGSDVPVSSERFIELMNAAGGATYGMNQQSDWATQTAFLQTSEGTKYLRTLQRLLERHVQSLRTS